MEKSRSSNTSSKNSNRTTLGSLKDKIKFIKMNPSRNPSVNTDKNSEKSANDKKNTKDDSVLTSRKLVRNSFTINRTKLSQFNSSRPPKKSTGKKSKKLIDNPVLLNYVGSIIGSVNSFSFNFYKNALGNVSKNVAFSPVCLFHLLNILNSCSDEKNAKEIRNVLNLSKPDSEKYLPLLIDLLNYNFDANKGTDHVSVKSKAFFKENFLLKKYADLIEANYGVELNEGTSQLKSELDKLEKKNIFMKLSEVFMILNNSLSFDLAWKKEFNLTSQKGLFTKPNSEKISIELMNIPRNKFLYAKNPLGLPLKICEFPLSNEDYAFTILLPEREMIDIIEERLDYEIFDAIVREMRFVEVNTILPKFSITDELDLCPILRILGAESLVDFKNKKNGLCIDKAFYKTNITINEKSVSFNSDTNLILTRESFPNLNLDHPSEELNCENPFLFYIRNKSSNLILFMGKLIVPE
ncbi:unnamed protein product [Brachionus calyciflorus]|uniref:Serpin domain-containing protein n=1 Tax=Brachionus calyciflorus TaxID=104777 RepID=A0A813M7G6_9BILA|nr:unnamed protein product [Brachionus calyciflorus]